MATVLGTCSARHIPCSARHILSATVHQATTPHKAHSAGRLRKNWLFCGNDRGGRAAAIHFSLLASCKRHRHDPWVYYRDVLTRLPAMLPGASEEELLTLLPHLWKPA